MTERLSTHLPVCGGGWSLHPLSAHSPPEATERARDYARQRPAHRRPFIWSFRGALPKPPHTPLLTPHHPLPASVTSAIVEPAIVLAVGKEPSVIKLKQLGQLGRVKRLHGTQNPSLEGLPQELAGTTQDEPAPLRRRIVATARHRRGRWEL